MRLEDMLLGELTTAQIAHLDEISGTSRYLLTRARPSRSIALIDSAVQPQPWRGFRRLRAIEVASRRGGQPSEVRSSTLTHTQPIPHP